MKLEGRKVTATGKQCTEESGAGLTLHGGWGGTSSVIGRCENINKSKVEREKGGNISWMS